MKALSDPSSATLEALLESVVSHTGFGAIYTSLHEDVVRRHPAVNAFCAFCLRHPTTAPRCRYACRHATMQSLSSGEPYFQRCWAGLFYTTAAIAPDTICRGGLSIGGFYGEGEKGDIEAAVHEQTGDLAPAVRAAFMERLQAIRTISPAELRGIGLFLMEAVLSSGLSSENFFRRQNEKYRQQRSIAEAFQDIQKEAQTERELLTDTAHFIRILEIRDREATLQFISGYLARILAMSRWNLTKLKANARVLLAVMTSREIMEGAEWEIATSREQQHMHRIMTCRTTEDCCLEITDLVLHRLDHAAPYKRAYGSLAERVTRWMKQHYAEEVELTAIARAVGASTSTVTHELKRETGKTSRQLLAEIRIEEAKRFLATTSLEISAIAALCGFFDQSHFTRTFKTQVNLTPGRFRALLHFTKDDV